MDEVIDIVTLGRACRNAAVIKNRQPISKMYVTAPETPSDELIAVIAEELNLKSVEFTDDVSEFTTYNFKPQLRTVGPKYGKYLGAIRNILSTIDGNAAMAELKKNRELKLDIPDADVRLTEEDLLIETVKREGFETLADGKISVVIDKHLTPELIEEGNVREIISKIQTMRKDSGFEVMDKIRVSFVGNESVEGVALRNKEEISSETLAEELTVGGTLKFSKSWNINGEEVTISVEKVN